jgi:hypothetical protein
MRNTTESEENIKVVVFLLLFVAGFAGIIYLISQEDH